MGKWVFINDGLIEEEGMLHFKDLAFQRGYGLFDFFRLMGNEPLFLEDHLDRFYFSSECMHLPVPFTRQELKRIIENLGRKNNMPGTGIRLQLTGGYSTDGFTIGKPNFIISQHSFAFPVKEQMEGGIKLLSYPHQRQLSHIKTIDYLMAIWLQPVIKEKGFDDVLYHNNGFITECPRSNFFLVTKEDVLVTPSENILQGVTRKHILEIAEKHFKVEERPVRLDEIIAAKEAFITSTTRQILPVAQIDDVVFAERKITLELLRIFRLRYFS
jgi:D-alanine transaminase/branched-chain amino acid aminotransferase